MKKKEEPKIGDTKNKSEEKNFNDSSNTKFPVDISFPIFNNQENDGGENEEKNIDDKYDKKIDEKLSVIDEQLILDYIFTRKNPFEKGTLEWKMLYNFGCGDSECMLHLDELMPSLSSNQIVELKNLNTEIIQTLKNYLENRDISVRLEKQLHIKSIIRDFRQIVLDKYQKLELLELKINHFPHLAGVESDLALKKEYTESIAKMRKEFEESDLKRKKMKEKTQKIIQETKLEEENE